MTPVFQRIVDPERGDCHRAAVASILDLALDDVPEDLQNGFEHERFLAERGLCALHLESHRLKPHGHPEMLNGRPWDARQMVRFDYAAGSVALASVPSQMYPSGWHAIVVGFVPQPEGWVRVECVHDPNPGNAPYDMECTEIRALTFFLPRPKESACRASPPSSSTSPAATSAPSPSSPTPSSPTASPATR